MLLPRAYEEDLGDGMQLCILHVRAWTVKCILLKIEHIHDCSLQKVTGLHVLVSSPGQFFFGRGFDRNFLDHCIGQKSTSCHCLQLTCVGLEKVEIIVCN